jgi:hypothetical protein
MIFLFETEAGEHTGGFAAEPFAPTKSEDRVKNGGRKTAFTARFRRVTAEKTKMNS